MQEAPGYTISDDERSITCQRCGLTSHNPHDVSERYCGRCHVFHEDTMMYKTANIDIRVEPELIERLDAWRAQQRVPPSRSAAIVYMLEHFLDSELEEAMARLRARYEREQQARRAADG
jgi:hypothetical protein